MKVLGNKVNRHGSNLGHLFGIAPEDAQMLLSHIVLIPDVSINEGWREN